MTIYDEAKGKATAKLPTVQVNIKGFSRGAATSTVFANIIKNSNWGKNVNVNLVVFDAVHGTSPLGKHGIGQGHQPDEQDVSGIDEKGKKNTGTTYIMPIKGKDYPGFQIQDVKGYKRLIIGYGPEAEHNFGITGLEWNNKIVEGMGLSELPEGLFVAKATGEKGNEGKIIKVKSLLEWFKKYHEEIFGKADKKEKRHKKIIEAVSTLLPGWDQIQHILWRQRGIRISKN
jgi:hypothetical protein